MSATSRASPAPQAQWNEDKDKCQATCVRHSCRVAPAGCGGHLGRVCRAGLRQELGLDAKLPHFLGALSPTRLGTPWGEEAMPPPSGQGFSEHRGLFFSASLRCEERQTVSPRRSGLCSAPPCRGSREEFQQTAFAQVFFPKNSLRKHNISSSLPHCYPDFLAGQMKTPSSVSCSDWPMSSGYSTIRIETTG